MSSVSYSSSLLFINILLWFAMLRLGWPALKYAGGDENTCRNSNKLFFSIFFIYCVFAFAEHDTYHMWDSFILNYGLENFEPIYHWLIEHITGLNYFLWRAIVWGVACGGLYAACKLLKSETYATVLTITLLLPTSYFVATRGTSGHVLSVLGILLILRNNQLYNRKIIVGTALFVLSFFLHRSNIIMIAFIFAAVLYPYRLSRKFVIGSLLAFPILVSITSGLLNDFISGDFQISIGRDMDIQGKGLSYATREASEFNLIGQIANFIEKSPMVYVVYYMSKKIVFKEQQVEPPFYFLYKLSYFLLYASFLFFFQETSIWFHERLLFMSLIPMCLVIPRVISFGNSWVKEGNLFVLLSIIAVVFKFYYRYYIFSKI